MNRLIFIFRLLIVVGFGLALLGSLLDLLIPGMVPAPLEEAYDAHAPGDDSLALLVTAGVLMFAVVAGAVAANIGLLLLKRWSRRLALWTTVLSLIAYPMLGAAVTSGWALMLTETATLLWGAALAMAYFSELKMYFDPDAAPDDDAKMT